MKPPYTEFHAEARRLLDWWAANLPDDGDGFWGEIDTDGRPVREAPRGVILNTRLLWFFSAMASYFDDAPALALAKRAADYIRGHFVDPESGSVYWLLDAKGEVLDGKKQTYALAFTIYAFAEYYAASGDAGALALARDLQLHIEAHHWDAEHGGYIEALGLMTGEGDQRLSDKDIDAPKTMNTHLHVLEAYTRLHAVAPSVTSKVGLLRVLTIFVNRFAAGPHLRLFFDMDWTDRTAAVSFGHDIEASWLLWEAAEGLGDPVLTARVRPIVLVLAQSSLSEGLGANGELAYERGFDGHLDPDGEWWGQAEALVGFANAWQLTGDDGYLTAIDQVWVRLKMQFGAGGNDEWTWYARDAVKPPQPRAGLWKCPYHNGRAMIELDRRLKKTTVTP